MGEMPVSLLEERRVKNMQEFAKQTRMEGKGMAGCAK